jgi:uncharacterized protein (DUF2236 family)
VKKLALDLTQPAGEPGLAGPGSLSWEVFSNPIALGIGGITAVILELAEPRVRSGVWNHSTFRTDPLARMERTGLAAMVTVFGAKSVAERMIAGIGRMHDRVKGTTPCGQPYHASDPELLDWVHATAAFGFLEAFATFVRPLSLEERDAYYAEGLAAAHLYGATGAPATQAQREAQFAAMRPKLERSEIVFEFLSILREAPLLPRPLRPLQRLVIRAAVEITPADVRETLGLGAEYGLRRAERAFLRGLGRLAGRIQPGDAPAAQARRRLAVA